MRKFLEKHAEYKYLDEFKTFGWFIKFYGGRGGGGYFEPSKDNESKEDTFERFEKHCKHDIPYMIKEFSVKMNTENFCYGLDVLSCPCNGSRNKEYATNSSPEGVSHTQKPDSVARGISN